MRCWTELSPEALRWNAREIRRHLPNGASMMAVVKADGYGHGARAVAATLAGEVEWFGVACSNEAAGIDGVVEASRIFLLSPLLPEERARLVASGWQTWVGSVEEAKAMEFWKRALDHNEAADRIDVGSVKLKLEAAKQQITRLENQPVPTPAKSE